MKIDNIRLLVTKFDESYSFYEDKLGLKATWGKPGDIYAHFQFDGGGDLAIFKRELMAQSVDRSDLPTFAKSQDRAALILKVKDVDKTYDSLKKKEVKFENAPTDNSEWGIRVAHLRDPDDNLIEIMSDLKK